MNTIKKLLILSLTLTIPIFAQAAPNIGTVLQEVNKVQQIEEKKSNDIPEIGGIQLLQEELPDDEGQKLLVNGFKFEGNDSIDSSILSEIVKPYEKKELTFSQLKHAVTLVTKYYRDQGYFVARAYIPKKQTLENNVITVIVLEAKYGTFNLNNQSRVKNFIIQGYLDNTQIKGKSKTASVNKYSIERTLLLVNDLPGVEIINADVKPGKEPLTSDFDIVASEDKLYDSYIITDNYGGKYTGENRLMLGTAINSPFLLGDKLAINLMATEKADILSGRVSYDFPILYSGLSGTVGYSQTEYELSDSYSYLDATGTSKSIYAKLSYPLIRSRLENLYISTQVEKVDLEDKIGSIDDKDSKDLNKINLRLNYDKASIWFGLESYLNSSLMFTYGNLDIDDPDKKKTDENGANTQGDYSKVNSELSNVLFLTKRLSLNTSISYQHTLKDKNLNGSEDLSIGGVYGVKLYPDGELSAENGYVANIELKYQLPYIYNISNQIGVFYDIGKVSMTNNASVTGFESRTLQDIGISYYVNYKDFFMNFYAAYKVGGEDVTSESDYDDRYMISLGYTF